jgi:glutaconyl-CoA/methylmalonyl-CoA decarboxylase subunit gamma|tara:strand:+ start:669 stop:908 length:240 start_codon:yes stop_codon:yes gene_type:complete
MKTSVKLPRLGDTVDEVYLLAWKKSIGDQIEVGDMVLEVETDKASVEVPSPVSGKITELLFKENDVIKTGDIIFICETD